LVSSFLVLACFAAAFMAYTYLEPNSISSFVSTSAPKNADVDLESSEFDTLGKHHGKHQKHNKHNGGKQDKKPHPVRATPAPVKATTGSCFTVANGNTLNVRSSACGSVTTTISSGTKVVGVGSSATKSGCTLGSTLKWQQISSPVSGYVADTYLVAASCDSSPPPATTGGITLDQLVSCMPGVSRSKATSYLPYINSAMTGGGITTRRRQAAFLAQVGHESGSLVYMEEIASGAAYEGRKDLGNTQPGDGKRYKGRGPIQITGRANYDAAGKALGLDLINNPTQAATPEVGFRLAVWFWNRAGLNTYADQNTQSAFDSITRKINGGLNGKADRDSRWASAKRVLGA